VDVRQHIATGAMEPREHEDFVAGSQIAEPLAKDCIDDYPRVRCRGSQRHFNTVPRE
jgi:hypothetical protein